jgi:CRP/FNR family transcriptional regulator, cyclic AMP receptor protein
MNPGGVMANGTPQLSSNSNWADLRTDPALGSRRVEVDAGAIVYECKSPSHELYIIDSGQVRTYEVGSDESTRLIEILGPGEWCGEEALASTRGHSCRAVAAEATVLWAVPVENLMELLTRKPAAAAELIRQLATRLQAAREDASRFVFDDCNARLVKTLLRFSGTAAATRQEDGHVVLRITHRQLAEAVGAARETVSLALTQLRQRNLLRTGRNRLIFFPESLRTMGAVNPIESE